jgi:hypothetical protein
MTKKLGWAALGLLLLFIFLLSWAPYGVKAYAERHYPVKIGAVKLHLSHVVFVNVLVDRDGVRGSLHRVRADWSKNVVVEGGALTVNLDTLKSSEGSSAPTTGSLEGVGLKVTVKKGEAEGTLEDVRFDAKQVCFKTGSFSYQAHKAAVTEGCVSRGDKKLTAKRVEIPFELPFEVPRIEKHQAVKIEGVKVDPSSKVLTFDAARLDPFFEATGPATARLTPDEVLLLALDRLKVDHPWISPEPVTFSHVTLSAPKSLVHGKGEIRVGIGPVVVEIEPWSFHVLGHDTCNHWVEAMPEPMPEALQQARDHFSGDLSFEVKRDPSPHFEVHDKCKFECSAEPIKSLRSGRITYMAYDKNDKLFARTTGQATKDWIPIALLPPHVPKAFVTMEDPGFLGHHGIIPQALENSFKANLQLGRFFRGGSTISMQLAKNLWLRRHKTIGRKAQEALLTTALESCLTKSEILELYLNVVEMGPNLYGIGPASKQYFDHPAEDLEPDEAFYLASILPHPRRAIKPGAGGLERTRSLMRTLAARGFINDDLVPIRDGEVDSSGWDTE